MVGSLTNPSEQIDISNPEQQENPTFTTVASPSELEKPSFLTLASHVQEENLSIASPVQEKNPSFASPVQEEIPSFASPVQEEKQSFASPAHEEKPSSFTIASPVQQENSPFITIASPSQENSPFITIASPSPSQENSPFITIASPSPQQETPKSPVSEHSQQQNPSPIKTAKLPNVFQFLIQAEALISTIAPLVDIKLNPEGFGTITMSASSFSIAVGNSVSDVMCRLFLESDNLRDYQYVVSNPRISKRANVGAIFQNLAAVHDKEIITVFYPYMSTQLFFQYGDDDDLTNRFSVELSEPGDELEMFPNYWVGNSYEGHVPVGEQKRMIRDMHSLLKNEIPPEVSVAISTYNHKASIAVGEDIRKHEELKASRPSYNYARFYWNHVDALEKAIALEEYTFYVKIIEEPLSCVMMRFEYPIGSLLFLTHAGSFYFAGSKQDIAASS